jgi:hypothetical protein
MRQKQRVFCASFWKNSKFAPIPRQPEGEVCMCWSRCGGVPVRSKCAWLPMTSARRWPDKLQELSPLKCERQSAGIVFSATGSGTHLGRPSWRLTRFGAVQGLPFRLRCTGTRSGLGSTRLSSTSEPSRAGWRPLTPGLTSGNIVRLCRKGPTHALKGGHKTFNAESPMKGQNK